MKLRKTQRSELEPISSMEKQPHASKYINQTTLAEHTKHFEEPNIIYLTIVSDSEQMIGYFILCSNLGDPSVEFRRVIIDSEKRGAGQQAIGLMEQYCKDVLNKSKIWLDVYADNEIGRHIYTKLGYSFDREINIDDRTLQFYSKLLTDS